MERTVPTLDLNQTFVAYSSNVGWGPKASIELIGVKVRLVRRFQPVDATL
jgi:hypothetical protein